MNKDIKIIYMGTPEFAVPTLKALNDNYTVQAVVTVPDKPKGRGKQVLPSDVKIMAAELGLPVLQPEKLKDEDFVRQIKEFAPDIIIVVAFRILPEEVYTLSRLGTFNIHGSILPKYRGAAPINWAVINGDTETGLTSFLLKKEVDTGDILLNIKTEISESTTFGDLYYELKDKAPQLAIDTVELLVAGNYTTQSQDESLATKAPKIFSDDCKIDWSKDSMQVKNLINGVSPIPGAWTMWGEQRIKILRAIPSASFEPETLGKFRITKNTFDVQCSDGAISILDIQMPGKKSQRIQDFINGWKHETQGKLV